MSRKSILVVDDEKSQREILKITMKVFQFFIGSMIAVLIFSALAFAQTENVQIDVSNKVGFIDSRLFYAEYNGIQELATISKQVKSEFNPEFKELIVLSDKIVSLSEELQKMLPHIETQEFDETPLNFEIKDFPLYKSKLEEYEKLLDEFRKKSTEVENSYENRKRETEYSVRLKIALTLRRFTQEKGYTAIVDMSEIKDSTFTTMFEDAPDVTREFIDYYNALEAEQQ